jgi:hypothetical protein
MDTHPDDLKETERRLSAWEPASGGLDADAMLFAAGLAAARPGAGRFVWPALSGCLAVIVALLGCWLVVERSERQHLARQLRNAAAPAPPAAGAPESPAADESTPSSILAAHRALERGLDELPAPDDGAAAADPLPLELPVLRVWQRNALVDP